MLSSRAFGPTSGVLNRAEHAIDLRSDELPYVAVLPGDTAHRRR